MNAKKQEKMQLERVTKAQAERLKKSGFDWKVDEFYDNEEQPISCTAAPTIPHALMWLREVKGVNVIIVPIDVWAKWSYRLHFNNVPPQKHPYPNRPPDFTTHALAESAGLDAALDWLEQNEKEAGNG